MVTKFYLNENRLYEVLAMLNEYLLRDQINYAYIHHLYSNMF